MSRPPDREALDRAIDQIAALQGLETRMGEIARQLAGLAEGGVLFLGSVELDGDGRYSQDWPNGYASVLVVDHGSAGLTLANATAQGSAPETGAGIVRVPVGGAVAVNLNGHALSLYGRAGETVTLGVYVRPQLPWATGGGTETLYRPDTATVEAQRTPTVFGRFANATVAGNTVVWTPAAGKRYRLMAYRLELSANATRAVAGALQAQLVDSSGEVIDSTTPHVPAVAAAAVGSIGGFVRLPGNGYLSPAAGNVLRLNLAAALTDGRFHIVALGTEE